MLTSYWIDRNNTIVKVSGSWDVFAKENDGDECLSDKVIGRNLLDFISGDLTRMWIDVLIKMVRLKKTNLERPYRCDSPNLKRFMELRISQEPDDLLRFDHYLLSTEPFLTPVYFHSDTNKKNILLRCSICNKVYENNQWREADELIGKIFQNSMALCYYTVCEDCKRMLPNNS